MKGSENRLKSLILCLFFLVFLYDWFFLTVVPPFRAGLLFLN